MTDSHERRVAAIALAELARREQEAIERLVAESILARSGAPAENVSPPPGWERTLALAAERDNPLYAADVAAFIKARDNS